jgi:hypothetical protein
MNNQPILVAAEIENYAVVAYEVDGAAELAFDIARTSPRRLRNHRIPRARRTFRLPVTLPELLERSAGNHLHARPIACHQIGDKADSSQDEPPTSKPASFHTV